MIEGLKSYGEYRESGIPWASSLPAHWKIERAKRLFTKMDRPVRPDDEVVTCFRDGVVTLRKNRRLRGFTEAIVESGYQGIRKGDLVIHGMDAFAGAIGVSDSDGKGTPVYNVCQPRQGVIASYYAHTVREMSRSQWILALAKGIRERSTDFRFEMFGNQFVPLPPPDEQAAIVRFLDHANRKIDGFIRAKKKLIGLLNEQKQAIIHRAVTRGLDPDVPLKPSGIPWLGDIPAHWEVRRLRTIVKNISQGVSPQTVGFLAEGNSWGVLKAGCVNHGVFRQTEHKQLPLNFQIDPAIIVRVGDVLISRACGSPSLVGSVGKIRLLTYKLILSDKIFRVVFHLSINSDFMVYAMNGVYYRQQVEQAISGADGMANNLPLSELRGFVFAVPPLDESAKIAEALDADIRQFNTAITRTNHEIALMQEYRTRLTADIVTGKLDVQAAAAELPDFPAEAAEIGADDALSDADNLDEMETEES